MRTTCKKAAEHPKFDNFIILLIIFSSIHLALENPLNDPNGLLVQILDWVDIILAFLFTCEAAIKIIAYGFVLNGPDSYLRNYWNAVDFVIVCFSVNQWEIIQLDSFIRVLRD